MLAYLKFGSLFFLAASVYYVYDHSVNEVPQAYTAFWGSLTIFWVISVGSEILKKLEK